jgi:hypothetical protein
LISTPPDPFEEWYRQPIDELPDDSPFIVRRARPEEFERIYDTVDAGFGRMRPRPVFDWLYRKNPMGIARCWVQFERASGQLLKVGASFPWPIWRGREVLMGSVGGDAATVPQWQRKGLNRIRRPVRNSHPWYPKMCGIAGPNANSRAVGRRLGRAKHVLGRLRGGIAPLRAAPVLERFGIPAALAPGFGATSDAFFSAWPGRRDADRLRKGRHIEGIRRFAASDFDEVTLRHMSWPEFWCPHNADFLNWRYLDHPGESYIAFALLENERPEGYAVLRIDGEGASLAEFAVATEPRNGASALLGHAISVAIEAGCSYLNFFATPAWRHWHTLRRTGFLPYRSQNYFEAACPRFEPEILQMERWQILPGDRDYH